MMASTHDSIENEKTSTRQRRGLLNYVTGEGNPRLSSPRTLLRCSYAKRIKLILAEWQGPFIQWGSTSQERITFFEKDTIWQSASY
jgi:hypothetical protein